MNNLNADVSEKVTRPETAEVGQALVVKEIDEEGKPTVFEAEDIKVPTKTSELENDSGYLTEHQDISGKLDAVKLPEAIDTALAEAKESGAFDGKDGAPGEKGEPGETTYIENPYDDTELKSEIAAKITAPENPAVGKVFKIKSVNEDGTFIGEWADGGVANLDVKIAGKSIVENWIAEIPIASSSTYGVVKYLSSFGISTNTGGKTGYLAVMQTSKLNIDGRRNDYQPISAPILDYAVKAAMCDGKGAAWTAEEQAAARERMNIGKIRWQHITSIILSEETNTIVVSSDESGVPIKEYAPIAIKLLIYIPADSTQKTTNGDLWMYPSAERMENPLRVIATISGWKTIERNIVQMFIGDKNSLASVGPGTGMLYSNSVEEFEGIDGLRLYINDKNNHIPVGTKIIVDVLSDREVIV